MRVAAVVVVVLAVVPGVARAVVVAEWKKVAVVVTARAVVVFVHSGCLQPNEGESWNSMGATGDSFLLYLLLEPSHFPIAPT
jgi:hypothetical protein